MSDAEPSARPNRRARLDPKARRAQIIEAACELLETHGVGAMVIEDVADAAGVSRSLVYNYFGDRDGLVAEVYLRVLQRIDDEIRPRLPAEIDEETVTSTIASCLYFARSHPAAWRLLVTDSVRRHPVVAQARAARIARITDGLDGVKAPLVADAAWGLMEAGVLHWVEQQQDLGIDSAAEMLSMTLWSGLGQVRALDD